MSEQIKGASHMVLIPCPFCGGRGVPSARARGIIISCENRDTTCPVNMRTHHRNTVEEAAADWNTRAAIAALPTPAEAVPYETRMGEAGDAYIRSVAFDGKHTLPAMLRWQELWDVLNKAAREGAE